MNIKSMALPAEHGGWGLLSEALLIGLVLAPSLAGFLLALSALSIFLLYQPVKSAWACYEAGAVMKRPPYEWGFILLYGGLAFWTFNEALRLTEAPFWIILLVVWPLLSIQCIFMIQKKTRQLLPELAGAIILSSAAPMILVAGGWPLATAGFVWVLLATRIICAVIFIRNFIGASKGKPHSKGQVRMAYLLGAAVLVPLAWFHYVPYLALFGFFVLMVRALVLSAQFGRPIKAKTLGWQEVTSGFVHAVFILLGYRLGI